MQLVMHCLKARTTFPRQCDNSSVWLKSLCLQHGMPYKRRWHDMTGFLASIWNNSLEKARGKAASPCCSNWHPPLGLSISDSLACACLLEHVLFHSVSNTFKKTCSWDFTVRAWLGMVLALIRCSGTTDSGGCPILSGILKGAFLPEL